MHEHFRTLLQYRFGTRMCSRTYIFEFEKEQGNETS
jgi:hypothetical protein